MNLRSYPSALGLALVALTVGCGNPQEDPTVFESVGLATSPDNDGELEEHFASEAAVEEAAAECMRLQGWPYQPWSTGELVADHFLSAPPRGSQDYAAERGYGILAAFPTNILTHPAAKPDPNQVYVDGLSPEEKHAFYQTLLGIDGSDGERRASVDPELYARGGCRGEAREAVGDDGQSRLLSDLYLPFQQLEAQVNADPRLLAYDELWAECMAEAGFRFESSPQAQATFRDRYQALWASVAFPAAVYSSDGLQALSESDRAELYALPPVYDEDDWARGLDDEVAVAVQDAKCQSTSPRWDVFVDVLREFEDQFVADHQGTFDQLEPGP